ncbi:hypothetical protein CR513_15220, partial [Mucuna pruriens]
MTNKGTSDGRRSSTYGKSRSVGGRGQPTINSPTSTSHISTLESTIHILQQDTLPTVQEESQPTFVGDVMVTPSTLEDSFTPEYSSLHSKHVVDQRSFFQIYTTHGPFVVISQIIRQKFDKPGPIRKKSMGRTRNKSKVSKLFFSKRVHTFSKMQ